MDVIFFYGYRGTTIKK